jgi:hypothetical protein
VCPCRPSCLQLCDLYENDCIFDKFDCCMNGAATYVASGSYNNSFKVFKGSDGAQGIPLEATRDPMRRRLQPVRVSRSSGQLFLPLFSVQCTASTRASACRTFSCQHSRSQP